MYVLMSNLLREKKNITFLNQSDVFFEITKLVEHLFSPPFPQNNYILVSKPPLAKRKG